MKAVILHAYSRNNSGDGLLVDLAVSRLRNTVPDIEVVVIATDPESFPEYKTVGWPNRAGRRGLHGIMSFVGQSMRGWPSLRYQLRDADLIVGVGGGYLRADSLSSLAKVIIVHVSQLLSAAVSSRPTIYLPQSIGPFPRPVRSVVRWCLSRLDSVFLRDDRSVAEFGAVNTVRVPDSAVLEVPRSSRKADRPATGTVALVARSLKGAPGYVAEIGRLRRLLGDRVVVAHQSTGRGNDDLAFYRGQLKLFGEIPSLREALDHNSPGVVVSVRLHGALEAILGGVPAIHLSYERKGYSAYRDLGLEEFVLDARTFDAERVVDLVRNIQANPGDYWERVSRAFSRVEAADRAISQALARACRRD